MSYGKIVMGQKTSQRQSDKVSGEIKSILNDLDSAHKYQSDWAAIRGVGIDALGSLGKGITEGQKKWAEVEKGAELAGVSKQLSEARTVDPNATWWEKAKKNTLNLFGPGKDLMNKELKDDDYSINVSELRNIGNISREQGNRFLISEGKEGIRDSYWGKTGETYFPNKGTNLQGALNENAGDNNPSNMTSQDKADLNLPQKDELMTDEEWQADNDEFDNTFGNPPETEITANKDAESLVDIYEAKSKEEQFSYSTTFQGLSDFRGQYETDGGKDSSGYKFYNELINKYMKGAGGDWSSASEKYRADLAGGVFNEDSYPSLSDGIQVDDNSSILPKSHYDDAEVEFDEDGVE